MRSKLAALALALTCALAACGLAGPATDLSTLVVRDGTYYDPQSMEPFSGHVYRTFRDDPDTNEIEGSLLEGTWHGELVVYHPSGRVRYLGSFDRGARCGPWTENAADEEYESIHDMFRAEIASMGVYPPCPDD